MTNWSTGNDWLALNGKRDFCLLYLSEKGEVTDLRFELHIVPLPVIGWMINLFMKPRVYKKFDKLLHELKRLCEKTEKIPI